MPSFNGKVPHDVLGQGGSKDDYVVQSEQQAAQQQADQAAAAQAASEMKNAPVKPT